MNWGGFLDAGKDMLSDRIGGSGEEPPQPEESQPEVEPEDDVLDEDDELPDEAPMAISDDLIGGIMGAVWPFASKHIETEIFGAVERSISGSFNMSNLMNVFKFTNKSMGSVVPTLKNFKLIDTSGKSVVLACDVEYNGDAHFEAEVGTSFANVPIGIKDLSFNGPLQIELKDLCGKVPFVSAAISYFTKPPKVDFRMTKAAEFVNNPMVSKNLKNLVSDSMKTQLLEPQRMVIPMAKSDASVYKYPMPKHLLELNVIEAKDLFNADSGPTQGVSDPFCMIYLDPANQGRTEIIRNDLNPVWNYKTVFSIFRKNIQIQIQVKDADDLQDFTSMPNLDNVKLPSEQLDKLPFGIGAKISEHVDGAGGLGGILGGFGGGGSSGGGFGGFMGTLGGFGDKLGGLNEKIQAAKDSIPIPGLEEQFQNYMEDELGAVKVQFGKICAKQKHVDKWWKLKGKGIDTGKIHLGLNRLDKVKNDEVNPDEPSLSVLQFYLREVEGIFTDQPDYDAGEQKYHAVVEIGGQVLDLGFGKIDPDDKHNFCTFDQAAYSVLQDLPSDSNCTLKIYLVANQKSGTEEQFLGEGRFPLPVDDKSVEITHRSHPFTEKSSIRGRITIQRYQ